MGVSWQTPDQKAFIEDSIPSYTQHSAAGTDKAEFWPDFLERWFKAWPLPEPSPDIVQKEGSVEKATKADRKRRVGVSTITCQRVNLSSPSTQQLKRVFKTGTNDGMTGGRRNLHLENPAPRRRSEVQVYMTLYYDARVRPTVIERWAEADITNMNFGRSDVTIPEDEVDPEDSALFKDTKIPLCFKNHVARELYSTEEEEIKEAVRLKRQADFSIRSVYDASEEDRLELVRDYQK